MLRRAQEYAAQRALHLLQPLGGGSDGSVWLTSRATALKVHRHGDRFLREIGAYRMLSGAESVSGHMVPRLIEADETRLAFEMTVVEPPFLLDFASAYPVAEAPEFPPDVLDQWLAEKQEQFGVNWRRAALVLRALERDHGLRLLDVHPGNIRFESDQAD